ncbi:hypothetical protein [Pseudomonas sp. R37(2017)]|uniref:hypothetical protein n=1 Tax=Pseudomonas sp. R37(2017) TaxID=1981685 RepID=UPI001C44A045|nr:hypothetical protein [Pseudomonas sp. R37(2017)]
MSDAKRYTSIIHNIGTFLSGDLDMPLIDADTLVSVDGMITYVGRIEDVDFSNANLLIDAKQSTVMPGLIDNHTHPTLVNIAHVPATIIGSGIHCRAESRP